MSRSLNGTSDYLSSSAAGGFLAGVYPSSVALWMKASAINADRRGYAEGNSASNNTIWAVGQAADGNYVRVFLRDDTNTLLLDITPVAGGDAVLQALGWAHIVFTLDASRNYVLYLNGTSRATGTLASAGTWTVDRKAVGALLRATAGSFFAGNVAEVATWNVALSAGDITNLYAGRSPMALATLPLSYWRLRDDGDFIDVVTRTVALTNSGSTFSSDNPTVDDLPGEKGRFVYPLFPLARPTLVTS